MNNFNTCRHFHKAYYLYITTIDIKFAISANYITFLISDVFQPVLLT